MDVGDIGGLPGFRRRIAVLPAAARVTAAVEDDYHSMAVTLHHDGTIITSVEAKMERSPWSTCPGAPAALRATFGGVTLAEAPERGDTRLNCTHLHDLAVLAAAHSADEAPTCYDIAVCDPIEGLVAGEIRRNGALVMRLGHRDGVVVAPAGAAGLSLSRLRAWIDSLDSDSSEAARLLQWGTILAHGRAIPIERQSDARRMPPNCFTFQPERRLGATRIGRVVDFSLGGATPLDHLTAGDYLAGTLTSDGLQALLPGIGKEIVR